MLTPKRKFIPGVIFLMAYPTIGYLFLDMENKEPLWILMTVLVYGYLISLVCTKISDFLYYDLSIINLSKENIRLLAPFYEELFKIFIVFILVFTPFKNILDFTSATSLWKSLNLWETLIHECDFVIYSLFIGVGFALGEFYLKCANDKLSMKEVAVRCTYTTFNHVISLSVGLVLLFFLLDNNQINNSYFAMSFFVAALCHLLLNMLSLFFIDPILNS